MKEVNDQSTSDPMKEEWSPQIQTGASVLIPDSYVPDLSGRLSLYRRLAVMENSNEVDGFAAELIDRFGPLPKEVEHLLRVVCIKQLCRGASVEQVDAGPKGAVLAFRNNFFAAPEALITLIASSKGRLRLRPDHKLIVIEEWPSVETRFTGISTIIQDLVRLTGGASSIPELSIQ